MEREYIAFISYRHKELDLHVARRLHTLIEHYRIPRSLRKGKEARLGYVFRDQDELPVSSNLSEDIRKALDHSQFLIVVCTPDTPSSPWCAREIEYFLEHHDREHVLAVLANGTPQQSFPDRLVRDYDEHGRIIRETEPLAANIVARTIGGTMGKLDKEFPRIVSALLGCAYDTLINREKRYRMQQIAVMLGAALVLTAAFAINTTVKNIQIDAKNVLLDAQNVELDAKNQALGTANDQLNAQNRQIQEQYRQIQISESEALAKAAQRALNDENDRYKAIDLALEALPYQTDRPYVASAERALTDALYAYKRQNYAYDMCINTGMDIDDLIIFQNRYALVSSQKRALGVWDLQTSAMLWQKQSYELFSDTIDLASAQKILVHEGRMQGFVQSNQHISCFDLLTGEQVWYHKFSDPKWPYLSVNDTIMTKDGLVLISRASGRLLIHQMTLDTGAVKPVCEIEGVDQGFLAPTVRSCITDNGALYLAVNDDGEAGVSSLWRIRLANGDVQQLGKYENALDMACAGSSVLMASLDLEHQCVITRRFDEAEDGAVTLRWQCEDDQYQTELSQWVSGQLFVNNHTVYVTLSRECQMINADTGVPKAHTSLESMVIAFSRAWAEPMLVTWFGTFSAYAGESGAAAYDYWYKPLDLNEHINFVADVAPNTIAVVTENNRQLIRTITRIIDPNGAVKLESAVGYQFNSDASLLLSWTIGQTSSQTIFRLVDTATWQEKCRYQADVWLSDTLGMTEDGSRLFFTDMMNDSCYMLDTVQGTLDRLDGIANQYTEQRAWAIDRAAGKHILAMLNLSFDPVTGGNALVVNIYEDGRLARTLSHPLPQDQACSLTHNSLRVGENGYCSFCCTIGQDTYNMIVDLHSDSFIALKAIAYGSEPLHTCLGREKPLFASSDSDGVTRIYDLTASACTAEVSGLNDPFAWIYLVNHDETLLGITKSGMLAAVDAASGAIQAISTAGVPSRKDQLAVMEADDTIYLYGTQYGAGCMIDRETMTIKAFVNDMRGYIPSADLLLVGTTAYPRYSLNDLMTWGAGLVAERPLTLQERAENGLPMHSQTMAPQSAATPVAAERTPQAVSTAALMHLTTPSPTPRPTAQPAPDVNFQLTANADGTVTATWQQCSADEPPYTLMSRYGSGETDPGGVQVNFREAENIMDTQATLTDLLPDSLYRISLRNSANSWVFIQTVRTAETQPYAPNEIALSDLGVRIKGDAEDVPLAHEITLKDSQNGCLLYAVVDAVADTLPEQTETLLKLVAPNGLVLSVKSDDAQPLQRSSLGKQTALFNMTSIFSWIETKYGMPLTGEYQLELYLNKRLAGSCTIALTE